MKNVPTLGRLCKIWVVLVPTLGKSVPTMGKSVPTLGLIVPTLGQFVPTLGQIVYAIVSRTIRRTLRDLTLYPS